MKAKKLWDTGGYGVYLMTLTSGGFSQVDWSKAQQRCIYQEKSTQLYFEWTKFDVEMNNWSFEIALLEDTCRFCKTLYKVAIFQSKSISTAKEADTISEKSVRAK